MMSSKVLSNTSLRSKMLVMTSGFSWVVKLFQIRYT